MWHKLCRTFQPWCPCIKTRCLFSLDFAIILPKYVTYCHVRFTVCTVLDGFFPYLAQMITSMRGCVACNDVRPWPVSSRSFSHDFAIKLLKYIAHLVLSTLQHIQFWMNSFHIWHKWSLAWEDVLHVTTFDLDLYLKGYLSVILPILWIIFIYICDTNTTPEGTMCHVPFPGQYVEGQGHPGRSNFCSWGWGYPCRSLIYNF